MARGPAAKRKSQNRQDALAGLSQVAHHGAIAVNRTSMIETYNLYPSIVCLREIFDFCIADVITPININML
ncbi:hypothetical protein C5Y93_07605 [Blastopirellula marina]|uniref:Uncharacterized protein n=1 Tax=Blastopirellula marina TaxID=124 RepID=A0A2S8GQQ0_9BACT|nr:hypothetical protein C5Y93_07605 [Blastopirellula marina]